MWDTIANLASIGASVAKAVGGGADAVTKASSSSDTSVDGLLMKPESFMSSPNTKSPTTAGQTAVAGATSRKAKASEDPLELARRIAKAMN